MGNTVLTMGQGQRCWVRLSTRSKYELDYSLSGIRGTKIVLVTMCRHIIDVFYRDSFWSTPRYHLVSAAPWEAQILSCWSCSLQLYQIKINCSHGGWKGLELDLKQVLILWQSYYEDHVYFQASAEVTFTPYSRQTQLWPTTPSTLCPCRTSTLRRWPWTRCSVTATNPGGLEDASWASSKRWWENIFVRDFMCRLLFTVWRLWWGEWSVGRDIIWEDRFTQ